MSGDEGDGVEIGWKGVCYSKEEGMLNEKDENEF